MDHAGDISVSLDGAQLNKPIPIAIDLTIPPEQERDFRIWFTADESPDPGIISVSGKLIVYSEGGSASSEVHVTIASDSKKMRKKP
jgi:hypothetical protein